jgi:hypothetical protein
MKNGKKLKLGAEICADGITVGTVLTLLPRRHGGEAVPTAETMLTVAVGTDLSVPTDFLCRRLTYWPSQNGPCADGPDI